MEGRVPHCPVERARVLGLCISCSRRPPQVGARALGVALPFRIYADSRRGTWPVVWDRSTIHARARLDDGIGVANCRPTHARVTGGLRGGSEATLLICKVERCVFIGVNESPLSERVTATAAVHSTCAHNAFHTVLCTARITAAPTSAPAPLVSMMCRFSTLSTASLKDQCLLQRPGEKRSRLVPGTTKEELKKWAIARRGDWSFKHLKTIPVRRKPSPAKTLSPVHNGANLTVCRSTTAFPNRPSCSLGCHMSAAASMVRTTAHLTL